MDLNRLSVKFPIASAIDTDKIVPVFHRWIQQHSIEGVLVDVADYSHVPDGPGILLVGHEGDYAIDYMSGRPELMYLRKRNMTRGLRDRLRQAIRLALQAAKELQANHAPHGPVSVRTDELTIALIDRLHAPNTDATWAKVRGDIEAVVSELYGGGAKIERVAGDARQNFAVRVTAKAAADVAGLLDRLAATAAA